MLFNSYGFLFVFLPIVLAVFLLLRQWNVAQVVWLAVASLFFYGWWRLEVLPILIGSVLFNYAAGRIIIARRERARLAVIVAVAGDIVLLGYYKYAGFLFSNACIALHADCHPLSIVLPIGISFFTFTQIAYVVDAYAGKVVDTSFPRYLLFVTYFPHLIAGPILHHASMMPQFRALDQVKLDAHRFSIGLTILVIGLFKKVCIADSMAPFASPVFDAAIPAYSTADAWIAAVAYTLQIYFDFSGYCDMALGMSFLFGIKLPINFDSPYRSLDIIEFWRRWHMTLSRFLRDYLYIPLGGNRHGSTRRYANLMATMLLGGLWHGAAWTFVIWGGLHGLFLIVNHAWRATQARLGLPPLPMPVAWSVTLLAVVIAWVFFRAPTLDSAIAMLRVMAGFGDTGVQSTLANANAAVILGLGAMIVLFMPNTQQLMQHEPYYLGSPHDPAQIMTWRPKLEWALAVTAMATCSVIFISRQSVFLYFQF